MIKKSLAAFFTNVQLQFGEKLLLLFLSGDVVFIMLHILRYTTGINSNLLFSIEYDRGYGELYQYLKELWLVLFCLLLAKQSKSGAYISWAGLFSFLLADDALKLHENWGLILSTALEIPPKMGLRPNDWGEILVYLGVGIPILVFIGLTYRFSPQAVQKNIRVLAVLLAALVFFGGGVDMLHSIIATTFAAPTWDFVFGTLEDSGEMLVMSGMVCFLILVSVIPASTSEFGE